MAVNSWVSRTLTVEDVIFQRLTSVVTPSAYSLVVTAPGEIFPWATAWRQAHIAIIEWNEKLTFARLLQQALAQWLWRPVGTIRAIEHRGGRLGIYV